MPNSTLLLQDIIRQYSDFQFLYPIFNIVSLIFSATELSHAIPDVELIDGSKVQCFSLEFPQGSVVETIMEENTTSATDAPITILPCILRFSSDRPVSTCSDIVFTDSENRK